MRIILVLALLVACNQHKGEQTAAGPVGAAIDLRDHLKPEVRGRAPADDKATKQEFALDIHGAQTKIVWRTFEDGGAKYIVSAQWEVVTPGPDLTLEPQGAMNPENAGTVEAPVQAEILRVRWHDNSSNTSDRFGDISVKIDAAGKAAKI